MADGARPMTDPQRQSAAASGKEISAVPARAKAPARRRWLRRTLLLLGPLLVAAVGGILYLTGGRYVSTENAYVKADKVMIAAEVSGLISEVDVHENQRVAAGDVLFRIDDRSYRIALDEADAQLARVRDDIEALKASYRQKQEELARAQDDVAYAQKVFNREAKLMKSRAVPVADYDAAEHNLDVAKRQIAVIGQQIAQITAQLGGEPDLALEQHPRYREALAARERASLDLARTVVRAPFAGIASNTPQVGEQVIGNGPMSSPVMSVVADSGVWIEANFKETELTHVQPGQPVTIQVDAYPGRRWQGRVQSLSQATGAEFSVIPPQNATGNWVKVVQRIPVRIAVDATQDGPDLRAGMSTTVEIDTGSRHRLPALVSKALSWVRDERPALAEAPAPQ